MPNHVHPMCALRPPRAPRPRRAIRSIKWRDYPPNGALRSGLGYSSHCMKLPRGDPAAELRGLELTRRGPRRASGGLPWALAAVAASELVRAAHSATGRRRCGARRVQCAATGPPGGRGR
eukprot:scaffold306_cov525-Prasinococcus_capsulatus_cf.AAC.53